MIVDKIHCEKKYCVLLGDFNIDLPKFKSHLSTENFPNTLGSYCFQPQILQPTRITDHSATLIDNIFFNSLEHFSINGNLCYDLSDHLPNFLPANIKVFQQNYSNFDKQAPVTHIQSTNWDVLLRDVYEPSSMFDSFYNKISEVIDSHILII